MDILLAIIIVALAWIFFGSLKAVLIATVAVAVVVWAIRNSRRL